MAGRLTEAITDEAVLSGLTDDPKGRPIDLSRHSVPPIMPSRAVLCSNVQEAATHSCDHHYEPTKLHIDATNRAEWMNVDSSRHVASRPLEYSCSAYELRGCCSAPTIRPAWSCDNIPSSMLDSAPGDVDGNNLATVAIDASMSASTARHVPDVSSLGLQETITPAAHVETDSKLFAANESANKQITDDGTMRQEHDAILRDLERCWMLNMSINFRDHSGREKFFVTYAVSPTVWRRLTVSIQYRNASQDSLEAELQQLHLQRDKSYCIFDALRESLSTIQFFDTITNLKLVTDAVDEQLHVHVREDTNEIIDFPPSSMFEHILCPRYSEDILVLEAHISGFVYKITVRGRVLIRKDIPGHESVDEFMYEVNALNEMSDSSNVIQLCGLVTDTDGKRVKGLLLHYAPGGSLADVLYDHSKADISTSRREKWAQQITTGLADIHEAGFVQGDFTLSNIVIDEEDNAVIIDINRRGCPLGWEPPELLPLIHAGHRISMYVCAKTDLYQLGMCLWALAKHDDDPHQEDIGPISELEVSPAYRALVTSCLSHSPKDRLSAIQLVNHFRSTSTFLSLPSSLASDLMARGKVNHARISPWKTCVEPTLAMPIEDVHQYGRFGDQPVPKLNAGQYYGREHSVGSDASSTCRCSDSGTWSSPRIRGRTLIRADHATLEQCLGARSGTSASPLSTRELQTGCLPQQRTRQGSWQLEDAVCFPTRPEKTISSPDTLPACTLCSRDSGFDELLGGVAER